MNFRISSKTAIGFLITLFVISAGFLTFPSLVSAGTITYRTKYISGDWTTYIYRYDASTDSFSSNLKYSSTYDYFDDNATVGDILYLGRSNVHSAFDGLVFYIGTAMSGTGITIVPEYYNGSDWVTVVDYKDDTEQFTATGERIFQFDPTKQTGWSRVNVNGATEIWIRFRISALDTITEGGAQSTQRTKWRSDRIWVEDYSSSTPATTDDIYNADKNGTFDLLEETPPATGLVPTYSLRPTDELAITVDVTLSSDTDAGSGDTVDVHGTDIDGTSLTESIDVSAGAGTYTTVNKFSSISSIDCNGFSAGTVKITQNQWGVVWKKDNWYRFDKGLYFSNTYFADSGKQYYINIKNWQIMSATVWLGAEGSNITFGELVDETSKSTKNGVSILFDNKADQYINVMVTSGGSVKLYSCYLSCINRNDALVAAKGTADANNRVWNTVFTDGVAFSQTVYTNIFNLNAISTSAIVRRPVTTATVERVYGNYVSYGAWFQNTEDGYIKDIFGRNMGYAAFMESEHDYNCSLVNGDFDAWKVRWSGTNNLARLYRKYTVNIKVIDKDGNPIEGANVTLKDVDGTEVFSATTDSNGEIPEQEVSRGYCQYPDNNLETNLTKDYSPHTLTISHQDYPSREFKFTLDKKIDWEIALKDKPVSNGSIKVWGTEYADDEAGTIYAQVFYGDGTPCDTLASSSITATVYKSDGTKIIDGAQMNYVSGSNGIYKYDFNAGTFSSEGVYIIDTVASSSDPNITAYNSNEIHISKSANLISQNLDQKISEVASSTWHYTSRSLTDVSNIADAIWNYTSDIGSTLAQNLGKAIWEYTGSALDTTGNAISKIWSYTGSALDTAGNAIAKVWSFATRKLTSRQIGTSEYIAGVSSSSTVSQVANKADQAATKYNVELIRKATFDFAGIADSGSTTTLVDAELDQPDDYWNDYELWMMSGDNIGQKKVICDFDHNSNTITLCSALPYAVASGDQYVISHERKLVHAIWNWSSRQLTSAANIAGDIWNYTGGRTLSAIGSLAADIWNDTFAPTRTLTSPNLDSGSLATLEDLSHWTVYLSDVGQVLAGKTYRAKLYVLNYLSAPTDAYATPTATIYDADRNKVVENVEMTKISTGIYEYTYSIPSSAGAGLWETEVSVEVESGKTIRANDYWEVEASPAQVKINSISDDTIPSITANTTITNEGVSGYEYQYEYCLVDSLDNQCGGGDDIDYAKAAKYISAGENWTTNLTLNVSNAGTYYFKVVVYWGTERSVAYKQFSAVEAPSPSPGGGEGGGGGISIPTPKPKPTICKGPDLNLDGFVNSIDFSILLYYWKKKPPFKNSCVDINKDNKVDSVDFSIMLYWWNKKYV